MKDTDMNNHDMVLMNRLERANRDGMSWKKLAEGIGITAKNLRLWRKAGLVPRGWQLRVRRFLKEMGYIREPLDRAFTSTPSPEPVAVEIKLEDLVRKIVREELRQMLRSV